MCGAPVFSRIRVVSVEAKFYAIDNELNFIYKTLSDSKRAIIHESTIFVRSLERKPSPLRVLTTTLPFI
jgi:hypothetical protein